MRNPRRCRICGCKDDAACVLGGLKRPRACHWVADDLCSACAPAAAIQFELDNAILPCDTRRRLSAACAEFRRMIGRIVA